MWPFVAAAQDFPRPDGLYEGACTALAFDGFTIFAAPCDDPNVIGPRTFEPISIRTLRVLPAEEGELPTTVLEIDAFLARTYLARTFDPVANRCTEPIPDDRVGDNARYRFTAEVLWRRDTSHPGWIFVRPAPYVAPLSEVGKTYAINEISGTISGHSFLPFFSMSIFQTGDAVWEGSVIQTEDGGCALPQFRHFAYNRQTLGASRVGPLPPLEIDGVVRGQVLSSLPIITDGDPKDVHFADVALYRQNRGWLPGVPAPGQSVAAFIDELVANEFIFPAGRQSLLRDEAGQYLPHGEAGRFEFQVPSFVPNPDGGWDRAVYMVVVESALTDEQVLDDEVPPNVIDTRAVHFLPGFVSNLDPDPAGEDARVEVDPFPPLSVKRELAESLTAICPRTLGPVEEDVLEFLDQLAATPDELTEAEAEAIERGIRAERAALVGARLSEDLVEQSLDAFARLLSDFLGDFASLKAKEVAAAEKRVKAMQAAGSVPRSTLGSVALSAEGLRAMSSDELLVARVKIAGGIRKAFGLLTPTLVQQWIDAGMDPAEARARGELVKGVINVLARAIETETLAGTIKSELQRGARAAVRSSKARVMDQPIGISWCGLLASTLDAANERMIDWDRVDPQAFRADSDRVAATVSELSDGATSLAVAGIYLAFAAEASSITQTVGEIVQLGAPQARGATKAAQASKYVANVIAAFTGFAGAFGFGLDQTSAAIETALPELTGEGASPARTALAASSPPRAATAAYTPGSSELLASLDAIEAALLANQADQAALATIVTEPGSFARRRAEWTRRVDAFMTQLGGLSGTSFAVSEGVDAVLAERAELTTIEMNLAHRLIDLLSGAYSGAYAGAGDDAWRADRNRVVALIRALRVQIERFEVELALLAGAVASESLLPALDVEVVSLGEPGGGQPLVTTSPQLLDLVVRVRNLSDVSLPAFELNVETLSPTSSLSLVEQPVQAIAGLAPDDGVPDEGDDETTLELQVRYAGALAAESMLVRLYASEGGDEPVSFVAAEDGVDLFIDPTIADADLDGLPTEWENAVGLDPAFDDAALDLDGDGLSNEVERGLGTAPNLRDTDADGLDDDEELFAGEDGFRTDPLDDDTDRDGTLDGADGAPTDPESSLAATPPPEPRVEIDRDVVTLSSPDQFVGIEVTNAGDGDLVWVVQPEDPGLVTWAPGPDEITSGPAVLFVQARAGIDLGVPFETRLHVVDTSGGEPDFRTLRIVSVPEPGGALGALVALMVTGWLRHRRRS